MHNLFVIGTSHKHAPVDIREQIVFAEEELLSAMKALHREIGQETVIVSTCNRTEIYVASSKGQAQPEDVKAWLTRYRGMELTDDYLFTYTGESAVRHLMGVASSIESQVIGDIQIIGQIKNAYQIGRETGTIGKVLTRLFEIALRTGKRVKTETDLFLGGVSVSYVAVELASKVFYPLSEQSALVVGAGDTGELTARCLEGKGVTNISIANRTESKGRELVDRLGFGRWLPLDQLGEELHNFDIVMVATGARGFVVTREQVERAISNRPGKPLLIVDLSVPRNVEPSVSEIPNVFCKDLNDLNSVIELNVERRKSEVPKAKKIIAEELSTFEEWYRLLAVTPVIADLRNRAGDIVEEMLKEHKKRFSEGEFDNVEKLVKSVVKKIIGIPMSHLLDASRDPEAALKKAEYVKLLFNLDDPENGTAKESEQRNGHSEITPEPVPEKGEKEND